LVKGGGEGEKVKRVEVEGGERGKGLDTLLCIGVFSGAGGSYILTGGEKANSIGAFQRRDSTPLTSGTGDCRDDGTRKEQRKLPARVKRYITHLRKNITVPEA